MQQTVYAYSSPSAVAVIDAEWPRAKINPSIRVALLRFLPLGFGLGIIPSRPIHKE